MKLSFRELTNEELLLVAGGLADDTITVTGPSGGGGWGDDGPPSDPWGPGGPPNEPIDNGGAGGDGGGGGGNLAGDGGQEFRPADINGDGKADSGFYRGEDGKLYYKFTSSAGESSLSPVTKLTGSVGVGSTTAGSVGANGVIPSANITYTTATSVGVIGFEIDPTQAIGVHPK